MSYFDYDYKERNIADKNQKLIIKEPNRKQDKQHSNNDNNKLDFEQLEDWAEIMRSEIKIKDYPNGWFGKHLRCAQGTDIQKWLLEHADPDKKKA